MTSARIPTLRTIIARLGPALALVLAGCATGPGPQLGVTMEGEELPPDGRFGPPAMTGEQDLDSRLRDQLWAARTLGHTPLYRQVAAEALVQQNLGLAARAMSYWLDDHPEDREAARMYSLVLMEQGYETAAVEGLAHWIVTAPDPGTAWEEMIELLATARGEGTIRRVLDGLVETTGVSHDPGQRAYLESRLAWHRLQFASALEWARLAEQESSTLQHLLWLGFLHRQLGNQEEALATYQRALLWAPSVTEISLIKARIMEQIGQGAAATRLLETLPHTPRVLHARIRLFAALGQTDRVQLTLAHLAEDAGSGQSGAAFYLGLAWEDIGEVDQALAAYRRVDDGAFHDAAERGLARLLVAAERPDEAGRILARMRQRARPSERDQLWQDEVLLLARNDFPDLAADVARAGLEEHPSSRGLREVLAYSQYADGDLKPALRELRIANSLGGTDPDLAWTLEWLGEEFRTLEHGQPTVLMETLFRLLFIGFLPEPSQREALESARLQATDEPRLQRVLDAVLAGRPHIARHYYQGLY